jgi:hypothetical protein
MVVTAGDAWIAMAKEVLHGCKIDSLLQEVRRSTGPKAVTADTGCIDSGLFQAASNHAEDTSGGQRLLSTMFSAS